MKCIINYTSQNNLPLEDAITALQAALEMLNNREDGIIINLSEALADGQRADIYLAEFSLSIEP
jgi:hypothetical protein